MCGFWATFSVIVQYIPVFLGKGTTRRSAAVADLAAFGS
jgi:hypothetical protein